MTKQYHLPQKLFWGIAFFLSFFSTVAFGDNFIGIGYTTVKLPSNDGIEKYFAPNGETTPGIFNIFLGSNAPFKVTYGFSFYGYTLKKWVSDYSGRMDIQWKVLNFNGFLCYRTLFGQDEALNPSFGLRIGGSIIPIELSGNYSSSGNYGLLSNSTREIAPYIGADIFIPIAGSHYNFFGSIEKTFCKYKDIDVGALALNIGIAYVLKHKNASGKDTTSGPAPRER